MTTLQFKTNINCKNCIRSITPFMEEVEGIASWVVNTENPDKILTVEVDALTTTDIIAVVEDAGFDIQVV